MLSGDIFPQRHQLDQGTPSHKTALKWTPSHNSIEADTFLQCHWGTHSLNSSINSTKGHIHTTPFRQTPSHNVINGIHVQTWYALHRDATGLLRKELKIYMCVPSHRKWTQKERESSESERWNRSMDWAKNNGKKTENKGKSASLIKNQLDWPAEGWWQTCPLPDWFCCPRSRSPGQSGCPASWPPSSQSQTALSERRGSR